VPAGAGPGAGAARAGTGGAAPPHWEAATGLEPLKTGKRGFGTYLAADYDELVDCPVELGAFWSAEFRAGGVPHRLVVAGATASFDSERLVADMQKICEARSASGTTASGRRSRTTCSC
jgi:predicted metalloprotease with PDZ domain